MQHELTNLLPRDRVRSLRQLYFLRLAVVAVLLLSIVAIAHAVFLFPTHLFLSGQVRDRTETLASLKASLEGSEEREVSERIASLTNDATYLAALGDMPQAATSIAAIINIGHVGVRLTGFSFDPGNADRPAKMTVSGVADTRESLRSYEQSLLDASFIDTTDLPISAYAKERDIPFTVTLTGSFKP